LETFSHSTISRTFKSFEEAQKTALESRFGEELKAGDVKAPIYVLPACKPTAAASETDANKANSGKAQLCASRFPSVADTAKRRAAMTGFLPQFQKDAKRSDVEAAGCQFTKNWHERYRRLLL
jgi:hypothetical protein